MKDLEKLRDEKCLPIAQEILNDLATDMIPDDANVKVDYNPILLKILARTFEADTNIATENSYLFQVLLGVFSALNRTVQECTTVPIDDVRYGVISKKILAIVAKAKVRMGAVTPEESIADFAPIKEELNGLFAEEKLSMLEIKYMMDNIFESFNAVQTGFNMNVEQSSRRAEAKLFKLEDMVDLSMKKLDDVLRAE